ncbi:phage tail protein [Stenotrophomonas sp. Iso1]|uniref:phage tail protein n=1 Tax=Stenotrophomonas sp. Iso1 TaxID=2977283 RepID=UPI0022B7C86D|nr:phage tail protein [Stenotrophomonas sp. Iso1]
MRVVFTPEGRAEIINAQNTGTKSVLVTQIGVTEQAFVPNPEGGYLTLPGERKRLTTFAGSAVASDVIHVSMRDDSDDKYSLYGIGLYLDTGTLLCVYSQPDVILEKSPQAMMLLAVDMMLTDIDAASIVFGSTEFLNPPATTEVQGVVELATDAEAITGKDTWRALTASNLLAVLNERFGIGAPTAFAKKILAAATAAAVRNLLELKGAALVDTGHGNNLDADLLDGRHGEHYLDWRNFSNVPRTFFMPGQVVLLANITAPIGLLPCDGREVLRNDYPALFAAIGTRYGGGNGTTTFNLPNVEADTVPVHTSDVAKVGQRTVGAVISHNHSASSAGAGTHAHGSSSAESGWHDHVASSGAGGGHAHGASASAVADHTHSAWTDAQGNHAHSGNTSGDGAHAHTLGSFIARYQFGSSLGLHENNTGSVGTNSTGHHAHTLTTNTTGNHSHNIGMNGAGGHSHTISVAAAPAHSHPVSVNYNGVHVHAITVHAVGDHAHAITVNANGGAANLPAGIRMRYFIAF